MARVIQEVWYEGIDLWKLQFWLADDAGNQCECDGCKDTIPSDFYVQILNEVDRRMTEEKLDAKIVFLIYLDLLWVPEKERIIHEDRFVLMFAPISRTYSRTYVWCWEDFAEKGRRRAGGRDTVWDFIPIEILDFPLRMQKQPAKNGEIVSQDSVRKRRNHGSPFLRRKSIYGLSILVRNIVWIAGMAYWKRKGIHNGRIRCL